MREREEFEQLTDRQYEVLVKVANALDVSADVIYYNDDYLNTMEKLAENLEGMKDANKYNLEVIKKLDERNKYLERVVSKNLLQDSKYKILKDTIKDILEID